MQRFLPSWDAKESVAFQVLSCGGKFNPKLMGGFQAWGPLASGSQGTVWDCMQIVCLCIFGQNVSQLSLDLQGGKVTPISLTATHLDSICLDLHPDLLSVFTQGPGPGLPVPNTDITEARSSSLQQSQRADTIAPTGTARQRTGGHLPSLKHDLGPDQRMHWRPTWFT